MYVLSSRQRGLNSFFNASYASASHPDLSSGARKAWWRLSKSCAYISPTEPPQPMGAEWCDPWTNTRSILSLSNYLCGKVEQKINLGNLAADSHGVLYANNESWDERVWFIPAQFFPPNAHQLLLTLALCWFDRRSEQNLAASGRHVLKPLRVGSNYIGKINDIIINELMLWHVKLSSKKQSMNKQALEHNEPAWFQNTYHIVNQSWEFVPMDAE